MPESITCGICSRTSHHPEDVRQGYCGNCHAFTARCSAFGSCPNRPTTIAGNVALCDAHAAELGL